MQKVEIIVTAKDAASQVLRGVTSSFAGIGNAVQMLTGGGGVEAITAAIIDFGKQAVAAARDGEIQMAKVESVIAATGGAAGLTAEQIAGLSSELAKTTAIDDDLIMSASGVLLTFREIGRDVFPQAMSAAADMSAVMGQSLQSSVVQLGKALNDPIAGITALSRVGVAFSDEQKEQIKNFVEMGQVSKAQAVILAELEAEFGGAAKAMADAGDGSEHLNIALGAIQGEIGSALLPAVRSLNAAFTEAAYGWQQLFIYINNVNSAATEEAEIMFEVNERLLAMNLAIDSTTASTYGMEQASEGLVQEIREQVVVEREAEQQKLKNVMATELNTEAIVDEEAAIKAATAANQAFLSGLQTLAGAEQSYQQQMTQLEADRAKTQAELNSARAAGWWEQSDKIQGYVGKLDELNAKETQLTADYQQQVNQRIYALVQQKLAVDGLSDAETNYLLEVGKNMGLYTEQQVETTRQQLKAAEDIAKGFGDAQKAIEDKAKEQSAKSGEYWKLAVERTTSTEKDLLDKSSENWSAYQDYIKQATDANIQAISEYINALADIPTEVTTNVTVTSGAGDLAAGAGGTSATGGTTVVYNIETAYIGADNAIMAQVV